MIDEIPWNLPTEQDISQLYEAEMARCEAPAAPPTLGCVDRSIGAAWNAALYSEDGPDLLVATGYLIFYVAKNHCFSDGNKRAAWLAALHQLRLNDLTVAADQLEAATLIDQIATGEANARDVVAWLGAPGRIVAIAQ